jgi:hypothetical protein
MPTTELQCCLSGRAPARLQPAPSRHFARFQATICYSSPTTLGALVFGPFDALTVTAAKSFRAPSVNGIRDRQLHAEPQ